MSDARKTKKELLAEIERFQEELDALRQDRAGSVATSDPPRSDRLETPLTNVPPSFVKRMSDFDR